MPFWQGAFGLESVNVCLSSYLECRESGGEWCFRLFSGGYERFVKSREICFSLVAEQVDSPATDHSCTLALARTNIIETFPSLSLPLLLWGTAASSAFPAGVEFLLLLKKAPNGGTVNETE